MCGFVGWFDPAGGPAPDRALLDGLLARIRHRGPDQSGVITEPGFALAACRLAIRGGSDGDQPLESEDRRFVLGFNGELFMPQVQLSDSRALLETYASRGGRRSELETTIEGGMGAFALFDRASQALTLGVDPSGIKPLYVLEQPNGGVWFASEIEPLLAVDPAARVPDPLGLAELLHYQRPRTRLPFTGIQRVHVTQAYGASPTADAPSTPSRALPTNEDPASRLAEAWRWTANWAAEVDGPFSLFLSGGLDSAAVAAWAGDLVPHHIRDMHCLTGRFAPHGGELDESAAAASVARHLGLQHEIIDIDDADLIADLPAVIDALEIPMMGPGSLSLWQLAKRAKQHGKVVLTGTGGDELLGGYARTALALGRAGPYTRGYEPLRARIEAGGSPAGRVQAAFSRFADLEGCLDRDFLRSLPLPAPIVEDAELPEGDADALLRVLLREEREGTLRGLLHVEDRVLAAHGLEGRPVPSLGSVREVAGSLPPEWLVGPDGEGKRVLREALRGVIPEAVRTDPRKRGFPTPFARAARGAGRDWVEDLLADRRFRERGWWNPDACRALLDEPRPLHDRALWAVCTWETWARRFLDGGAFGTETPLEPPHA